MLLPKGTRVHLAEEERVDGFYAVETKDGKDGWVWSRNVTVYPERSDNSTVAISPDRFNIGKSMHALAAGKHTCTPFGDAPPGSRDDNTDHLKARTTAATTDRIDRGVTLTALLAPGADLDRFDESKAAVIVGFVLKVKPGGGETVNCHGSSDQFDGHVEIVPSVNSASKSEIVVVEVTPQWRKIVSNKGGDWSTPTLRSALQGNKVRITGWLLRDWRHANVAEHTGKPATAKERATVWEIHPVTKIEVLEGGKWQSVQ